MIRAAALLASVFLLPGLALADEPDPSTVFEWQATVDTGGPGLARLGLPEGVLSRCGPDLADLRLYDARGTEIPYAIDDEPQQRAVRTWTTEIDNLDRRREVDTARWAPWIYLERFTIEAPTDGDKHPWTLSFASTTGTFVRVVEVRSGMPGTNGELLGSGTIFRLQDRSRQRLSIELPPLPPGPISVQLRGADGGYLEPSLTFQSSWELGEPDTAEISLTILSRSHAGGTTSLVLERPHAIVPRTLRIDTARPTFERGVTVWDEGQGRRDGKLGTDTIWRLDAKRAVQGLAVPIAPAVGERLRIEIDDGDSPPLDVEHVYAILTEATVVFDAPAAGAVTMRFGAERIRRPRYDIANLLGNSAWLQGEADAPHLFDPLAVHEVSLGDISASPAFSREPALAFAARPGKRVDRSLWSHLRPLSVPASDDHLVLVRLSPPELGQAREDLGDVRIVDAKGQQWPYLSDTSHPTTMSVTLELGAKETGQSGKTRYPLTLSTGPANLDRLEVQGPAGYFDRAYELVDGDKRPLAEGRLVREAGDPRPVTIALRGARTDRLELIITDGDDAALELTQFVAHIRGTHLLAALSRGQYELLVGNPLSTPPSYELARVRTTVMTVEPLLVEPGPLQPNPLKKQVDLRGSGVEKVLLWLAILAAVGVLGWITLRSTRE